MFLCFFAKSGKIYMFLSLEVEKFCSVRYFSYGNVSFLKIAVKCMKRSEQKCKLKNKRLGLSLFQLRTKKINKGFNFWGICDQNVSNFGQIFVKEGHFYEKRSIFHA